MASTQGTTEQKDSIREKVTSISKTLRDEINALNSSSTNSANRLQQTYQKKESEILEAKVKEIFKALSEDKSETGKEMRDLLVSMREKSVTTHDPLGNRGLMALEGAKLVENYVSPVSLWADVDTYESDPMGYILTKTGRKVADLLAVTSVKR